MPPHARAARPAKISAASRKISGGTTGSGRPALRVSPPSCFVETCIEASDGCEGAKGSLERFRVARMYLKSPTIFPVQIPFPAGGHRNDGRSGRSVDLPPAASSAIIGAAAHLGNRRACSRGRMRALGRAAPATGAWSYRARYGALKEVNGRTLLALTECARDNVVS